MFNVIAAKYNTGDAEEAGQRRHTIMTTMNEEMEGRMVMKRFIVEVISRMTSVDH